jgi:hypothetical protein
MKNKTQPEHPNTSPIQKVAYGSENHPLKIGDLEIQAYVLEDNTRVLSQAGVNKALGRPEGVKGSKTLYFCRFSISRD